MSAQFQPLPTWPRRSAKRYDCGSHGRLTAREAARVAGVHETLIHKRASAGVSGDKLVAPKAARGSTPRCASYLGREVHTTGRVAIAVACQIARAFPNKAPTVDQLRSMFSMSRATAYRWRRGWLDAHGVEA